MPDAGSSRASHRRRLALTLMVSGVVIVADQVTKSLAVADLHRPVHLIGPFGLSLGYNSGSAFSLFTGRAAVLGPVGGLLVVALLWLAWRAGTAAMAVSLGLVLGGAMGNLADRAFRGHGGGVVDFITLSHWPTFNVADASITVGVVLVALTLLRFDARDRRTGDGAPGAHDE
jgi:signal peptidase II